MNIVTLLSFEDELNKIAMDKEALGLQDVRNVVNTGQKAYFNAGVKGYSLIDRALSNVKGSITKVPKVGKHLAKALPSDATDAVGKFQQALSN